MAKCAYRRWSTKVQSFTIRSHCHQVHSNRNCFFNGMNRDYIQWLEEYVSIFVFASPQKKNVGHTSLPRCIEWNLLSRNCLIFLHEWPLVRPLSFTLYIVIVPFSDRVNSTLLLLWTVMSMMASSCLKDKKEGTNRDRVDCEWFSFRIFFLRPNQLSSDLYVSSNRQPSIPHIKILPFSVPVIFNMFVLSVGTE